MATTNHQQLVRFWRLQRGKAHKVGKNHRWRGLHPLVFGFQARSQVGLECAEIDAMGMVE
ncbi:hypothetical protein D3C75_1379880 [compost metagenome]